MTKLRERFRKEKKNTHTLGVHNPIYTTKRECDVKSHLTYQNKKEDLGKQKYKLPNN